MPLLLAEVVERPVCQTGGNSKFILMALSHSDR